MNNLAFSGLTPNFMQMRVDVAVRLVTSYAQSYGGINYYCSKFEPNLLLKEREFILSSSNIQKVDFSRVSHPSLKAKLRHSENLDSLTFLYPIIYIFRTHLYITQVDLNFLPLNYPCPSWDHCPSNRHK